MDAVRRGTVRFGSGLADGTTAEAARTIGEQKRRIAELEQTIEILSAATSFFARASDQRQR